MKPKALSLICSWLVCGSVSAVTITPLPTGVPNQWSAQFSGNAASNSFSLDLSSFVGVLDLTALLSANLFFGSGYNIASATFDGMGFTPVINVTTPSGSADYWTYGPGTVTAALHTLVVNGSSGNGGGFTGSLGISATPAPPPPLPVPEPETYALLLAGLGLVGFIAQRRQQR